MSCTSVLLSCHLGKRILFFVSFHQANTSTDAPSTHLHGFPNNSLASSPRQKLTHLLVGPVLERGWVVSSFRVAWNNKSPIPVGSLWNDIVTIREELDNMVKELPESVLIVSAIAGSHISVKGTTQYNVHPSVRYWVVSRQSLPPRDTIAHLNKNRFNAVVSLQLQPFQQSLDPVVAALGRCVKDNGNKCVRFLVDASSQHCFGGAAPQEPIMKLFIMDRKVSDIVNDVVQELEAEKFYVQVVMMQ